MPVYTIMTQDGLVSDGTKARIAEEIAVIHTSVMKIPRAFVRVIFLSYPKGSGYSGGKEAPLALLNCVMRSGHTVEDKTDLLKRLWAMYRALTDQPIDQIAISLQEVPSCNTMEMGQIMPVLGDE